MVQFSKDDITSASGGSKDSGKTFVRTLFFTHDQNDTMVDVINSAYMPKWNDCHPVYTAFFVTDIGEVQTHSDTEWYIEITYSNKVDPSEIVPAETPPWELPPQNVSISTFDREVAMTEYWDLEKKKYVPYVNSAGVRMVKSKVITVAQLSFTMNYRHRTGSDHIENLKYLYNEKSETVCNNVIPPLCGKLLPFSGEIHSVTDSATGRIKYEYESVNITIQIIIPSDDGSVQDWSFSDLDIGTLVRDKNGNLGAIYKFREAKNKEELATAPVKYGSIDELTIQRNEWDQKDLASFPFEEITEPMPLDNGKLDLVAIQSVDGSVPYNKIRGIESRPSSWSRFDLPKRR